MTDLQNVTSTDGTAIAFEKTGTGPAVILVASALADRSDTTRLAALLAPNFTVINYDRRGRGASGDTAPYAVERESEDIAALIEEAAGMPVRQLLRRRPCARGGSQRPQCDEAGALRAALRGERE